jgi:intracellular multiplication protein IcmL
MADEDALQLVTLRNNFYRDSYRRVLGALLLSVFVNVMLGVTVFYVWQDKPTPTYFATTTEGGIVPIQPLNAPVITASSLLQWATVAVTTANTYNFVNYRKELQAASEYFTPQGWKEYQDALKRSRNLESVIDRKLTSSAVATGAPVILDQGVVGGRYKWKVQLPILVTYESANLKMTQPSEVTLLITRVSTLETSKGVAIDGIYMSEQPIR